jgi:hypothetical protein
VPPDGPPSDGLVRAPLAGPTTAPMDIQRRLHVVSSSSRRAVIGETDVEVIKGLSKQTLNQQYVLDRSNSLNLPSDQSWAYTPSTKVNRAPFYSVNLPFGTGDGPYWIWKNEIGATYPFIGTGQVKVDGVTMQRLQGTVASAPGQPYYLQQLGATLPTRITPTQVEPWLQKPVYSGSAMQTLVGPLVSPADRAVISQTQHTSWKLNYQLDVNTTLLVEPDMGAITDLARIDQTLYATPDLANVRTLLGIFSRPQYASNDIVKATGQVMKNILADPPRLKVLNITYSQTPESVAEITAYAKHKADSINLVKHTIPVVLLIVGLPVIVAGLVMIVVVGRTPSDPTDEGDPAQLDPDAVFPSGGRSRRRFVAPAIANPPGMP